jgi:hypothetical protein
MQEGSQTKNENKLATINDRYHVSLPNSWTHVLFMLIVIVYA